MIKGRVRDGLFGCVSEPFACPALRLVPTVHEPRAIGRRSTVFQGPKRTPRTQRTATRRQPTMTTQHKRCDEDEKRNRDQENNNPEDLNSTSLHRNNDSAITPREGKGNQEMDG